MGLLLGLITYFGWGAGDIFAVYASRKVGSYLTTFYVFLFGFLIASLFVPFVLADVHKITPVLFILNFFFGAACLFGNFLINEGFRRSSASLVGIIVQSFPVILIFTSAIIFKDKLTFQQMIWGGVIFFGVFLCTVNFRDFKKSSLFTDIGIKYALLTALIFSVYFTFFRIFSDTYGWFWSNYISFLSFPVAILFARYVFKIKESLKVPKIKKILIATFFSGLLLRGADIALNYGIAAGLASTVSPLASASPTLFVTLSSLIFKDPLSTQQKVGIGICLTGILLLSFLP